MNPETILDIDYTAPPSDAHPFGQPRPQPMTAWDVVSNVLGWFLLALVMAIIFLNL